MFTALKFLAYATLCFACPVIAVLWLLDDEDADEDADLDLDLLDV